MEAANQIRMTPASEKVLNPNGTEEDNYHTFIIQEDNPNYIGLLVIIAQEITRRGAHFIKFVIRHSGSMEEVEANQFFTVENQKKELTRDIVIRNDGSFRKAQKEEMYIPYKQAQLANENLLNSCNRILAREGN